MDRRTFLHNGLTLSALAAFPHSLFSEEESYPPIQAVTKGPKFHWFGYYDKEEMDPSGRYLLTNQVDFQGRPPTPEDAIKVGMIDLQDGNKFIELGTSRAWGWQQGCMLQWIPGSKNEVLWNDREDGKYVSRVINIDTREMRTLPMPVYSLSPDGQWAVTPDFARIDYCRTGYGYPGIPDPCAAEKAPKESGIWRMNLKTGETKLIFSLADAVAQKHPTIDLSEKWNWFNHLLIAPDSKRIIFLHRWRDRVDIPREQRTGGFTTRMFTINIDGTEPFILEPGGLVSHFIWKGQNLVAWARPEKEESSHVIDYVDKTREYSIIGKSIIKVDGHMTFLPPPHQDWMLIDTYPDRKTRKQRLFLHHIKTNEQITLGNFYIAPESKGEFRCDLHPRAVAGGNFVVIDSLHEGNARQVYMIDLREIWKKRSQS